MAQKFLTDIDLNKNELQNAAMQNIAGKPTNAVPGQFIFDTTNGVKKPYYYDGTAWHLFGAELPAGAMKYIGKSSTPITDGETQNPTIGGTVITTKANGDVVLYGEKEFIWNGSAWEQFGAEGDFVLKTQKVNGKALSGDITINFSDLPDAPTIPTKLADLEGDPTHRTVTDDDIMKLMLMPKWQMGTLEAGNRSVDIVLDPDSPTSTHRPFSVMVFEENGTVFNQVMVDVSFNTSTNTVHVSIEQTLANDLSVYILYI